MAAKKLLLSIVTALAMTLPAYGQGGGSGGGVGSGAAAGTGGDGHIAFLDRRHDHRKPGD